MESYTRYISWLPEKIQQYNQLMTKFALLKERECAVTGNASGRKQKKENLLRMKENKTITREGIAELEYINKEEDARELYQTNITVIEKRKEKEIDDAKAAYQKALTKAEETLKEAKESAVNKYEKTKGTYDSQTQQCLSKIKREYDAKKQMFGLQKQSIEDERTYATKTGVEITLEQDKRKVLQEMQSLLHVIELSKTQVAAEHRDKLPPSPVLPEAIVTQYIAPQSVAPQSIAPQPPQPVVPKYDYSMLGEDTATVALREENKARRRQQERDKDSKQKEIEADNDALQREYIKQYGRPSKYLGNSNTPYDYVHVLENRDPAKGIYVAKPVTDDDDTGAKSDFFL